MGGVAIYAKDCLAEHIAPIDVLNKCKELNLEASMIKLNKGNSKLFLLGLYRQPKANLDEALERLSTIIEETAAYKYPLIIMGDINVDILKTDTNTAKLNEALANFDIERLSIPPTRVTNTTSTSIDCVCANHYTKDLDVEVIHTGISDHKAQICNLKISLPNSTQPGQIIRHFREENIYHLKYLLAENSWLKVHNAINVDQAYESFSKSLTATIEMACPKKKRRPRKKKNLDMYDNKDALLLKQAYLQALSKFELTGDIEDKAICTDAKKRYDLKLKSLCKQATVEYIEKSVNKPKAMWDTINKERKKQGQREPQIQLKVDGKLLDEPLEVAEQLNNYFIKAADEALKKSDVTRTARANPITFTCDKYLSELSFTNPEEVSKVIKTFKPKWSAGLDEVPSQLVKICFKELITPLTSIINRSFQEGQFPKCS
ncbi:uncharacterized protein LOC124355664 [Homalodisca vitripennis]|uniref:uncharacterized protein LOC124355664 n=1 Tax=Homalodisca vitripennis TaxID=197043 RepID=UPI001EECBF76|nr:uncharacterized protein LOC124355664 [Homalodisca vitripennis]